VNWTRSISPEAMANSDQLMLGPVKRAHSASDGPAPAERAACGPVCAHLLSRASPAARWYRSLPRTSVGWRRSRAVRQPQVGQSSWRCGAEHISWDGRRADRMKSERCGAPQSVQRAGRFRPSCFTRPIRGGGDRMRRREVFALASLAAAFWPAKGGAQHRPPYRVGLSCLQWRRRLRL
jgi:hypothetical protein